MRYKIVNLFLLSLAVAIFCYIKYKDLQPVNIVAIHQDGFYTDILVKNFPLTDSGKITWWLKNKDLLKAKYNVPKPEKDDGYFFIKIWDFGSGYVEDDGYDRLCFADMKVKNHCIEKHPFLTIRNGKQSGLTFFTDTEHYKIEADGKYRKL